MIWVNWLFINGWQRTIQNTFVMWITCCIFNLKTLKKRWYTSTTCVSAMRSQSRYEKNFYLFSALYRVATLPNLFCSRKLVSFSSGFESRRSWFSWCTRNKWRRFVVVQLTILVTTIGIHSTRSPDGRQTSVQRNEFATKSVIFSWK